MIYDEIKTDEKNIIQIIDSGIFLKNVSVDFEYAFYLAYKGVIEKIFYSKKNSYTFPYKGDGVYTCTFFKKDVDGNKYSEKYMFIIQHKKFIRSEIIAEADSYRIKKYDIESDVTFIVFNGAGSDKYATGFGVNYLLSRGYNVISCAQNKDQYQGLSFENFAKIISPHVVGKSVFLYGSSLGGYCAIYYAGAINGTVIAGSPRNTIHPIMKDFRKKTASFKDISYKHKDIRHNKLTSNKIYIITDPYVKEDDYFISKCILPAYSNVNIIEVPFAGHEVLYHVNKIKALTTIIESVVKKRDLKDVKKIVESDTEFTYLNKAKYHYEELFRNLGEAITIKSAHPLVVYKIHQLVDQVKEDIAKFNEQGAKPLQIKKDSVR